MLDAAANLPDDPARLKAMVAQLQAENANLTATLRPHDLMVQALRLRIARLKKQAFGKSSERIEREIEQLQLALEDRLVTEAERVVVGNEKDDPHGAPAATSTGAKARPSRRPRVSADTPRERCELDP